MRISSNGGRIPRIYNQLRRDQGGPNHNQGHTDIGNPYQKKRNTEFSRILQFLLTVYRRIPQDSETTLPINRKR